MIELATLVAEGIVAALAVGFLAWLWDGGRGEHR